MNNLRFATAMHILVLLDKFRGQLITSEFIAGSINVNAAVVRKEIKLLRTVGIMDAKIGKGGGLYLAQDPDTIRLGDLYKLVNQDNIIGRMNHPNPACNVGNQMNEKLDNLFTNTDKELVNQLNKLSLLDFSKEIK